MRQAAGAVPHGGVAGDGAFRETSGAGTPEVAVSSQLPAVHLLCGLNGAGKTTLARRLEQELPGVRFSLDEWMLRCFPGLPYDSTPYARRAEVCKDLMWETALQVLYTGSAVILDWNQWTRQHRAFWKGRAVDAGYPVYLHYVRRSLEVAVQQAEDRSARGRPGLIGSIPLMCDSWQTCSKSRRTTRESR